MLIPSCSNTVYIFRSRNGFRRIVVHLTITNVFFTFLFVFLSFSNKGLANESKKNIYGKATLFLREPFKLIKNFNGRLIIIKIYFFLLWKKNVAYIIKASHSCIHRCQTKEITTNLQHPRVRIAFLLADTTCYMSMYVQLSDGNTSTVMSSTDK